MVGAGRPSTGFLVRHAKAMERGGYIYILTNRPNGTLYVGVTSNLSQRITQHRSGTFGGFTQKYGLKRLVYVERHDEIALAIAREKLLKTWLRAWKVRLIVAANPDWRDLYDEL